MGLIARTRMQLQRLRYVWTWRLRYWWMDTESGRKAHIVACCLSALVAVLDLIRVGVEVVRPHPPGEPATAVIWWVVYLIVALVAAVVAYMRPKVETPKQDDPKGPTTEDGQAVRRYWGTCWVEDLFQLAWKVVGRDPIKGSGGK